MYPFFCATKRVAASFIECNCFCLKAVGWLHGCVGHLVLRMSTFHCRSNLEFYLRLTVTCTHSRHTPAQSFKLWIFSAPAKCVISLIYEDCPLSKLQDFRFYFKPIWGKCWLEECLCKSNTWWKIASVNYVKRNYVDPNFWGHSIRKAWYHDMMILCSSFIIRWN